MFFSEWSNRTVTFKGFHGQKLLAKFHSDGRVKVLGIYFQQQGDEKTYEKVNDLFSCDRCWGYEWPEPMENGHPSSLELVWRA